MVRDEDNAACLARDLSQLRYQRERGERGRTQSVWLDRTASSCDGFYELVNVRLHTRSLIASRSVRPFGNDVPSGPR
jgi:hypothetical protein